MRLNSIASSGALPMVLIKFQQTTSYILLTHHGTICSLSLLLPLPELLHRVAVSEILLQTMGHLCLFRFGCSFSGHLIGWKRSHIFHTTRQLEQSPTTHLIRTFKADDRLKLMATDDEDLARVCEWFGGGEVRRCCLPPHKHALTPASPIAIPVGLNHSPLDCCNDYR